MALVVGVIFRKIRVETRFSAEIGVMFIKPLPRKPEEMDIQLVAALCTAIFEAEMYKMYDNAKKV